MGTQDASPPGEVGVGAAGAAAGEGVLSAEHEEALRESRELTEHLQRMAADFDNFRKRAAREVEQARAAASDRLLGELLVVLDDLERALGHVGDPDAGDEHSQLVEGIALVHGRLTGVLREHGLEEIDASGAFDPHLHEALMMQPPADGVAEGSVVQVLQKGYRIGDRVLRHAKVIVAGG